jgi:hypothetical protein
MPSNKWVVISGTGVGWGIYDSWQEADERRAYVAMSHSNVRVVPL